MDETKEILLSIKHSVEVLDAKVVALQDQHHHMYNQIHSMNEKLDSHSKMHESHTIKLDMLQDDVEKLKTDVVELKNGQDRHERILESMALNSLEQEAVIRAMKRM